MVSTMTLPHHQVAPLPTYPAPPVAGQLNPMGGLYYSNQPVLIQPQFIPAGQIINSNTEAPLPVPNYNAYRFPAVPVGGGCYNEGMQVVWHGEFSRHFSTFWYRNYPSLWCLTIVESKPEGKWRCHSDSAKVRFCCQDCGNGWTSMKGRVNFWFNFDCETNAGSVFFKLYGQVCQKCVSGKFEYVMWYPEEVAKVMYNLYSKVAHSFYGQPPTQIRVDRRPGRPRNQHNSDLCQACRDGECDQGRQAKTVIGYVPTNMAQRVHNNQLVPVVNPQMSVFVAQPAMQHCGPVMTHAMNPTAAGNTVTSHTISQPNYITAPVTLSSTMQPTLTYSIGTTEVNEPPKLSTVEEHVEDEGDTEEQAKSNLPNGRITENDLDKTEPKPCLTTEVKQLPKPDTEATKSPMKLVNESNMSAKSSPPLAVASALAKLQINGISGKSPVKNGNEHTTAADDKISKDSSESEAKEKIPEKPIMNGYATAARKVASKPVPINGNA